MTQSITSRFVCARSVPVRRLSSKRARRRSSTRSRRAPSFEVCRDSPHPLVARAHASRHSVTQHVILPVIGREPDSRPSCSHVCNFNRTRQSIALVGSARRRARARACHWRFSAPSPRETSCHHTCAHALDTTTETTTTITPNSKSGSRSQWSRPTQRAVPPKPLPQAHCARAITGTKPTRHSDGRGRGGAAPRRWRW